MKFLIDAQLPRRLAHQLSVAGYETTHTLDLPQGNRTTDQSLITLSLKREPWKLLLVSTGNIRNDELLRLFQLNIDQLAESFTTFDFVELNRTSMICHL
jgi:predicted nuclease of predicted toxin-antitoxin system